MVAKLLTATIFRIAAISYEGILGPAGSIGISFSTGIINKELGSALEKVIRRIQGQGYEQILANNDLGKLVGVAIAPPYT